MYFIGQVTPSPNFAVITNSSIRNASLAVRTAKDHSRDIQACSLLRMDASGK